MWNLEQSSSYTGIGALAYVGLKTNNQSFIDLVNKWSEDHLNDETGFMVDLESCSRNGDRPPCDCGGTDQDEHKPCSDE